MASNASIRSVIVSPTEMCRVCLSEMRQVFIDVLGPNEPLLAQFVNEYYKVEIKGDDIQTGKSTKLCQRCMENLDVWRGHIDQAKACQTVVNYLSDKTINREEPSSLVPIRVNENALTSSDNMIQFPSESIQQSRSASIQQILSRGIEPIQHGSDFPSTSNSTEIIPFPSTSTEIISFPSTSTEITPIASTSTEITPIASTSTEIISFPSTSTEIIPFPSTSTEIIPFPSTSTEIFSSTPISTRMEPIWYSGINEITNNSFPSQQVVLPKPLKIETACVFCFYQYNEVSTNVHRNIQFCTKHSKPHTCLVKNCNTVFPSKEIFFTHYRHHLNLDINTYLCRICLGIIDCPRRTMTKNHTHQNVTDLFKCCSTNFTTMIKFVLHKLVYHDTVVIMSNTRSHNLKKMNQNVLFPTKCKIEPFDVKDDVTLTSKEEQDKVNKVDNGSYQCSDCTSQFFKTVKEYVEHSKRKHKNTLMLKESEIRLCPLCDNNYFFSKFVEHIENCTNTMKIGDKNLNCYGCIHCKCIFTKLTASQFRNHVLFCKTFSIVTIDNKAYKKCVNCTFQTCDDNLALTHASSNCLYFQLKMRYALGPDEKKKVLQRMEFDEEISKQQVDKDCTDNEATSDTSKVKCDTSRQYLLKSYNYFCNNCHNLFFDKHTFLHHMTVLGFNCRSNTLVYCQRCLTDFKSETDFIKHLPNMPKAAPLISIKSEEIDSNSNNTEDIIIESVIEHSNQNGNDGNYSYDGYNRNDVKVFEMNGNRYFQGQGVSGTDVRSSVQFSEPGGSNDYTDQEMEFNTNDNYMQCVVEEKPDLNQIMMNNSMQ
ncbi:uncharacterized protein LOC112594615 isoform X2 [Melanaphis sacchari]|uniref:uncharacterized protein LOC112594615 isoform X2 n=1 Tax=Melanaphis sacchari TaxID=742174 RepID=UPI000DC1400A|nr:uncharacterized protein LOC112594615 isoform X2 [Melanaphis sacchari]